MRIFLTGATGQIGLAALDALVRGAHAVTALVRTPEKANIAAARGARPIIGDLAVPPSYQAVAADHDAYVHTAFDRSPRGPGIDRTAVETLLPLARRARGTFVYTSVVWVLGNTRGLAAEDAPLDPAPMVSWRPAHERLVIEAGGDGLRTSVVRPGIVYGGARGIVADMLRDAQNGLMRVVGHGNNHWPLVYDRDLGELLLRLVEIRDAAGVYHANDECDERVNDLVEAIRSHRLIRPDVRYMPLAEARSKIGPLADALALDQIVRSPRARALGWIPSIHSVGRNAARLFDEWRRGQAAA
jgi:nucleoside-diphosphate-sugar epimerase